MIYKHQVITIQEECRERKEGMVLVSSLTRNVGTGIKLLSRELSTTPTIDTNTKSLIDLSGLTSLLLTTISYPKLNV